MKMKKIVKITAFIMIAATIGVFTRFFIVEPIILNAAVITVGSDKAEVKKVQQKLKDYGYYSISIDGIYGTKTKAAVRTFQKNNGLKQDGIVGNATAKALGIKIGGSSSSSGGSGSSDVYLLAKLIYAESRGEPYVGKVAVGAVVLNRVKSSKFPNSISGVIYQPWAFTCVNDGQIKLEPNAECKRAAQDALNGWDPSYGSIYYYNPVTATSQWIFSRKVTTTIGKHKFAV